MSQAQQYNLQTLSTQYGFDLGKMDKGASIALGYLGAQQQNVVVNMAMQQGYNVANLTLQQVNDMAKIASSHINDIAKINASGQIQKDVLALNETSAANLADTQSRYTGLLRASADAASIWATTQNNIARIVQDKTLDAAGKTLAIDTYNTNARAALQVIGSLAGNVDIARYMDQLLPA